MTAVDVRRATLEDVPDVVAVRLAVAAEGVWLGAQLPIDVEEDGARHRATVQAMESGDGALMLVADRGGEIVGWMVVVATTPGVGGIGMALLPDARGQRVGRRMLETAIDWARAERFHKLELQHWPWNLRARRLYESLGFVEEGYLRRHYKRHDGSLWDAAVMGKVLDDERPGHDVRATTPPVADPEPPPP